MSAELFRPGSITGYDYLETLAVRAGDISSGIGAFALDNDLEEPRNPRLHMYGKILAQYLGAPVEAHEVEPTVQRTIGLCVGLCDLLQQNDKETFISMQYFRDRAKGESLAHHLIDTPQAYINARPILGSLVDYVVVPLAVTQWDHKQLAGKVANLLLLQVELARLSAFNGRIAALTASFAKSLGDWDGFLPDDITSQERS